MKTLSLNRSFAGPMLVLAIMLIALGVVSSTAFQTNPTELALAITVDLTLISPLLYFLLVRKSNVPTITVIPVFILGMIVTGLILPGQHHTTLNFIQTWILPLVELTAVSIITWKFLQLRKTFRQQSSQNMDFFDAMKEAAGQVLPSKVSILLATEISTFYYGLINWKKRTLAPLEFSYHQKSGGVAILYAVLLIALVETIVLHLLIQGWSNIAAWVLTIISVYTAFQILGIVRSLSKRPTKLANGSLLLRYGILSEVMIPLDEIETIELSTKSKEWNQEVRKLSPLGDLESHNVILSVGEPMKISGLYGMKRSFKELAFYVDEPESFLDEVERLKKL